MPRLAWLILVALSGCVTPGPNVEGETKPTESTPVQDESWSFDGEFLAAGVDAPIAYTFEVPNGTTEVEGLLTWTIPGGELDFRFVDPSGKENGNGWAETTGRRYVTTTYPVEPGQWSVEVSAQQGVDIHFTMEVTAREAEPYGDLTGSFEIPPGNALSGTPASPAWTAAMGRDFAEINFNMVPGNWFDFAWQADGDVYFNVHFHSEGTTDRPIEHTGADLDGNFTAPANEVYSLLWRNEGTEAVTLSYQIQGDYRLHSMSRDG